MNPCRLDWQTEFTDQIDDLLCTQAVQNLKYYSHHHRVTRYEHVLLVAQLSFRIARAWGLDSRAVARSALLHDLYHGGKDSNYLRHARNHPLTALHNAGLKLAVGSSSKNAAYILERLDANRYFDAVCDGTMIAHSKPDPEVFTKAAAMVGLAPTDCLVVEDAAAGLEAARAGGMGCAIVGTAPMPFEPTYHMQDVTKLPGTIL